ncbi:unnamed protein product, partial [Gulo gulo]
CSHLQSGGVNSFTGRLQVLRLIHTRLLVESQAHVLGARRIFEVRAKPRCAGLCELKSLSGQWKTEPNLSNGSCTSHAVGLGETLTQIHLPQQKHEEMSSRTV